jgi:C4-dicarboxylate transporter/malic acid transport protein
VGTPVRDRYRGRCRRAIVIPMTTSALTPRHLTSRHLPRPATPRPGHPGPHWFTPVMGTGIVATAAVTVPHQLPGLHAVATAAWALAAGLLVVLGTAWFVHRLRHPGCVRAQLADPALAQSWGVPPMAVLTVGAGTLLLGAGPLGEAVAVRVDAVLWTLGALGGLASAVVVPYLMATRHELRPEQVSATWLLPVVPSVVSAATGALLVPHAPPGEWRLTLLLACYALLGAGLLPSVFLTTLFWYRLVALRPAPAVTVPTMWIVLGWLGQSVTAVNALGAVAGQALPEPYATGFAVLGLVYGVPVLGFALVWLALAAAITVRTARRGLPFALSWWSFTFPLGTVVTGTSAVALHSGSAVLGGLATALYLGLAGAWVTVVAHTVRGAAAPVTAPVTAPVAGPVATPVATPDPVAAPVAVPDPVAAPVDARR